MKKYIKPFLLIASLVSLSMLNSCNRKPGEDKIVRLTNNNLDSTYYFDGNKTVSISEYELINASLTEINSGFYVVKENIELNNSLEVKGELNEPANIIVNDGAVLNIGSVEHPLTDAAFKGNGTLRIFGQKEGTGKINIYTKDVDESIIVGQFIQEGANITINNIANNQENSNSIGVFAKNNAIAIERGNLILTGSFKDGLKASGIFVSGGVIDLTGVSISGDAVNSDTVFKTTKGSQVNISNINGNGIVTTGNIILEGIVNVSVNKTAIKSSSHIILGGKIIAETKSGDLDNYHGVESINGSIVINFNEKDPNASLKATDYSIGIEETSELYIPKGKRVIAQYSNEVNRVFNPGYIFDLTTINNVELYPAYSVVFDSIVN